MKVGDVVSVGKKTGVIRQIADNLVNGKFWKTCLVDFGNKRFSWKRLDQVQPHEDFFIHIPIPKELTAVTIGDQGPTVYCSSSSQRIDAFVDAMQRMWASRTPQ